MADQSIMLALAGGWLLTLGLELWAGYTGVLPKRATGFLAAVLAAFVLDFAFAALAGSLSGDALAGLLALAIIQGALGWVLHRAAAREARDEPARPSAGQQQPRRPEIPVERMRQAVGQRGANAGHPGGLLSNHRYEQWLAQQYEPRRPPVRSVRPSPQQPQQREGTPARWPLRPDPTYDVPPLPTPRQQRVHADDLWLQDRPATPDTEGWAETRPAISAIRRPQPPEQ